MKNKNLDQLDLVNYSKEDVETIISLYNLNDPLNESKNEEDCYIE